MQIVLPSEIRVWLKFAIGGSVRDFAQQVEMSPQYIYAVLRGEKEPSPLLLEKVGLEVVYRVRVAAQGGKNRAGSTGPKVARSGTALSRGGQDVAASGRPASGTKARRKGATGTHS